MFEDRSFGILSFSFLLCNPVLRRLLFLLMKKHWSLCLWSASSVGRGEYFHMRIKFRPMLQASFLNEEFDLVYLVKQNQGVVNFATKIGWLEEYHNGH
jgi:hypothetical protein